MKWVQAINILEDYGELFNDVGQQKVSSQDLEKSRDEKLPVIRTTMFYTASVLLFMTYLTLYVAATS